MGPRGPLTWGLEGGEGRESFMVNVLTGGTQEAEASFRSRQTHLSLFQMLNTPRGMPDDSHNTNSPE